MVSMKDIAKRCGVSIATVSKALNGKTDVGEETRLLIQETARELGYMANSAARSLKTNRTYNLGVLFVDEQQSGLTHPYFAAVLDSFKVEAEQAGYDITFINRNVGSKATSYLQHCQYRGVDGVVIACVDFSDPEVVELVNSDIPVVTIDHIFTGHTAVMSDNVAGMEALVEYVYSLGHRRIAMVRGESHTSVTSYRVASFYKSCQKLGIDIPEAYDRQGRFVDPETCAREVKALLDMDEPPTCILMPDDFSAIGGYNVISERGLRIPEDISVTGYDGINVSQVITPKLTTYQQGTRGLGQLAAKKLIEAIEHPKSSIPEIVSVPGKLLTGGSVRHLS